LLTKSREWAYEREWRMLGPIGMGESPPIKSVIFGLRCPVALQYIIVKGLQEITPRLAYWEMRASDSRFKLKRERINVDELMRSFPRASSMDFDNFDLETMIDSPRQAPA
jgi:hypothetical protein